MSCYRQIAAAVVFTITSIGTAFGQSTWTGATSTDWNTASNWSPSGVPSGLSAGANFTGNALGTVNVSASILVDTLTFGNATGNYTLTSSAGQTFTPEFITIAPQVAGIETINTANISTGSLLLTSDITFNGSTSGGTTFVIGPNTVIGGSSNGIEFGGSGNSQITASFATGAKQVTGGLTSYGQGTLTLSGNGTNLIGGLFLNGGTLVLDYSSNTAVKIGGGPLTLGGGVLSFTANSGTAITQTFAAGTTIVANHTDVQASGSGTITLNAGAMSRSVGGTADFIIGGPANLTFNVATTATTVNGLLGSGPAFATTGTGSTWATVSGGNIAGLTTYGTDTYTTNTNVDVTTSTSQSNITVNSLRFSNTGLTLALSGTNTIQSGGILVSDGSSGGGVITGGTIAAPGGEIIVHEYGSLLGSTINSALISGAGLTKTGPRSLTLGGNNIGLTGPINVNRGSLIISNTAAVNSASAINFNDARVGAGLQSFDVDLGNNVNGTIIPPISVSAFSASGGATVFTTGSSLNSRVTLIGAILAGINANNAALSTPIRFTGDVSNTSGFILASSDSFTGSITLSQGFLGVSKDAMLGNAANTLILDISSATGGGLQISGFGTIVHPILINHTSRVFVDGSNFATLAGVVTSAGSGSSFQLVKGGTGSLDLDNDGSGLLGGLTLSGGSLSLDYGGSTASKLGGGALTLNGGLLAIGPNQVTPVTQTIPGGTVVNSGHTDIKTVVNSTGTATLAAGAISRNIGGTVDFSPVSGSFTITTSTGVTFSLLGSGPAFVTVSGGTTWATVSGGAVSGLSTYSANSFGSGLNTDVTASGGASAFTTNSLRFNVPNLSLSLTGTNTLQSGGILVTPNGGGDQITGVAATLTAPSGGEILIHQYSGGPFTIGAALASTAGLTKTGPGVLTLSGINTGLTGPINVNRGSLTVSGSVAPVNSASQINFNDGRDGADLQTFTVVLPNGTNGALAPPIRVSASSASDYGTYFTTSAATGSTITLSGVISTATGFSATPIRFTGSSADTSGFSLTGTNTFVGNISLQHGSLGINADASLGNLTNTLTLEVNDITNGGLVFLNSGITVSHPIAIATPSLLVCNGADSNSIGGMVSGTGGINKSGAGTLTLSNSGNTVTGGINVALGTLTLGTNGGLPGGQNVTVGAGATFSPATAASSSYLNLTLNGGAFRVPSGTGQSYSVSQIVTNSSGGTIDFTGAGTDLLSLNGAGGISVNGNSTWVSPANATTIFNNSGANVPISIPTGVTLNNGIALAGTFGYRITGGGTLFQNSDATNAANMAASITVAQSIFRVTDASSNGSVGNLGFGNFTLDGGTYDYAGITASTAKAIALTANGGTIQVESAATTYLLNLPITGPAGLIKTGPGTLVFVTSASTFNSLAINNGTLQTANDNTLGTGPITIGPFGTLTYTATTATARTFTMNSGAISVMSGQTVTLNGAAVGGGFLHGPGTFVLTGGTAVTGTTSSVSAVINQTGAASFVDFTNGGALNIGASLPSPASFFSFTNQGSGSITLGAASVINAVDFQTYGLLTINPATSPAFAQLTNLGTTPLYFNGGSRTFIGTPATAGTFTAGVDLHGQNAVVAGGLFVNNGYVIDSAAAAGATSGAVVIADYGSLVKGAGFYQFSPVTQNGGRVQAGNSPGSASFGQLTFGPGGVSNYVFAIDDATGTAGPSPDANGFVSGWGLMKAVQRLVGTATTSGNFTWTADANNKLTFAIETLVNPTTVGTDDSGLMADFDPSRSYSWPAVQWGGTYSGPTDVAALDASTIIDTIGFENPIAGTFGWSLDSARQTLSLTYTPSAVPEPGTLALLTLTVFPAAIGLRSRRR